VLRRSFIAYKSASWKKMNIKERKSYFTSKANTKRRKEEPPS